MKKFNKDFRSGNVDGIDYHDPSARMIDEETIKSFYFDVKTKHHLPTKQVEVKATSLADAIAKLKNYVWYRQRVSKPTR